jgi:hypothetical protein
MQRLHTTFHLQKYLATKVNIVGQCPCVVFLSRSTLVEKMNPTMVKQSLHMLPNLAFATTMVISFDLWMSRDEMDIFALVIKYLNESQTPKCMLLLACLRCMKEHGFPYAYAVVNFT